MSLTTLIPLFLSVVAMTMAWPRAGTKLVWLCMFLMCGMMARVRMHGDHNQIQSHDVWLLVLVLVRARVCGASLQL